MVNQSSPVTDVQQAVPVAQGDVDAFDAVYGDLETHLCDRDVSTLKQAFARHRLDATQTREAETWVPRIGDPVKVSDSCEHSADWQRTDLWVAGVAVDERCRGINVTVTEQWPVPHRFVGRDYTGHTDGFLVARTDGKPDDLEPRAALNTRDAA